MRKNQTIASEYVGYGHPDKLADQISDAILDGFVNADHNSRCGIETMVKDNIVVLGGEVNSNAHIDIDTIVRGVFDKVKYPESHHLKGSDIKIINLLGQQSQEIHSGVDKSEEIIGAGDQGFMVGYATNETEEYMPLGMYIAKKICQYINKQNQQNENFIMGPDCKSQVVVTYDENGNANIDSILVSTQHDLCDVEVARAAVKQAIKFNTIGLSSKIFNNYINNSDFDLKINPCGSWKIGGPISDCGLTGRKIIVDNYGGYCNVGGGAFSGKDATKVDRSGAYMARFIAKNIVAAGLCNEAKVEISYAIGVPEPTSLNIEMDENQNLIPILKKHIYGLVDLTPKGILMFLSNDIKNNEKLARFGHFGYLENDKNAPIWESLSIKNDIRRICGFE